MNYLMYLIILNMIKAEDLIIDLSEPNSKNLKIKIENYKYRNLSELLTNHVKDVHFQYMLIIWIILLCVINLFGKKDKHELNMLVITFLVIGVLVKLITLFYDLFKFYCYNDVIE